MEQEGKLLKGIRRRLIPMTLLWRTKSPPLTRRGLKQPSTRLLGILNASTTLPRQSPLSGSTTTLQIGLGSPNPSSFKSATEPLTQPSYTASNVSAARPKKQQRTSPPFSAPGQSTPPSAQHLLLSVPPALPCSQNALLAIRGMYLTLQRWPNSPFYTWPNIKIRLWKHGSLVNLMMSLMIFSSMHLPIITRHLCPRRIPCVPRLWTLVLALLLLKPTSITRPESP
jgi:hypothetical protein